MGGTPFFDLRPRPLSLTGQIMPGCYYRFYETSTTTPAAVYADGALTTPLTNPLVADADGRFPVIYMDPGVVYRVQLYDAANTLQYDADPVHPHVAIPPGTLVMFDGTESARDAAYPPALWWVCNGANGTPDTRDRSPLGVSNARPIGTTGGGGSATTDPAGGHGHTITVQGTAITASQMPAHTHRAYVCTTGDGSTHNFQNVAGFAGDTDYAAYYTRNSGDTGTQLIENTGGGQTHTHDASAASVAAHTHTLGAMQSPYFTTWILKRRS